MYIEKYWSLLAKDIPECEDALMQALPDAIRDALDQELKKLQALNTVLTGVNEKSLLHQLRAKRRWAGERLAKEKDSAKRKKLEHELAEIESGISKELQRKQRSK